MKLVLALVLPAYVGAQCLSRRFPEQCRDLMTGFSQTPAFNEFYHRAVCFNFCNGLFTNTDISFVGQPGCVTGCTKSDIAEFAAPPLGGSWVSTTTTGTTAVVTPIVSPPTTTGSGELDTPDGIISGTATPAPCRFPRHTEQCGGLMTSFSQTQVFSGIPPNEDCFNFCSGFFQGTDTFYFGPSQCVTGCTRADIGQGGSSITTPPFIAGGQVETPASGTPAFPTVPTQPAFRPSTSCLSPRNTEQCAALMTSFSRTTTFTSYQTAAYYNFCDGVFQNVNSNFCGKTQCVVGCKRSDIPGSTPPSTAAGQIGTPGNVGPAFPVTQTPGGQVSTSCLSPRNTEQCGALMASFSRTSTFPFYQNAAYFNFCDGVFQNANSNFCGSIRCVVGCKSSDIPGSQFVGSGQVTNPNNPQPSWRWSTASATVSAHGGSTTLSAPSSSMTYAALESGGPVLSVAAVPVFVALLWGALLL